jgi:hypothetical protein
MAWQLSGRMLEACSCEMLCPCYMGPAEPDQGWCSGIFGFEIEAGESEGVDLAGAKAVWVVDLPGDFVQGNGTLRLFVDAGAGEAQRREIEAIFTAQRGGPPAALASAVITELLETQTARITIEGGEAPVVRVDGVGETSMTRVVSEGGPAVVENAPALAGLGVVRAELAAGAGSWATPGMRSWESGGSGSVSPINWTG